MEQNGGRIEIVIKEEIAIIMTQELNDEILIILPA